VRVSDADQKRAFNLMHQGEFLPALSIFNQQGAIRWSGRQQEAFDDLVNQWGQDSAATPDKSRFVFAYTNADVLKLNAALRQERAGQGALGEDRLLPTADGTLPFAEGDRIQITGTSRRIEERRAGLVNGAVGTILRIENDNRVTVALDGPPSEPGRRVSFVAGSDHEAGEFDKFRHGYAGTIYKGQGKTLDQTYLYHSEHWRSASGYVALTRHRENVTLFAAMSVARDLGYLARQMARIDDTRSASQFHMVENPEPSPVNLAERRAQVEEAGARRRQDTSGNGGISRAAESDDLREAREAVAEARRREQQQDRAQGASRSRGMER
jgi:hypothetical protein